MSKGFADGRSGAAKDRGRHGARVPAAEVVAWGPPRRRVATVHTRDAARLAAESKDVLQIYANVLQRDGPSLPLPPRCQRVKRRLVVPEGFGARWGNLLDSHEPAERGWERHLLPSAYPHTTQRWLLLKKQPQHRLIANNTF